jgi:hypothetical protein
MLIVNEFKRIFKRIDQSLIRDADMEPPRMNPPKNVGTSMLWNPHA